MSEFFLQSEPRSPRNVVQEPSGEAAARPAGVQTEGPAWRYRPPEKAQPQSHDPHYQDAQQWRKPFDDFIHEAERRGKEYITQREVYTQKYKINLTDGQFAYLQQGIDNELFDEKEIYKQAAALYIGNRMSLPSDFVRENLDYWTVGLNIDDEVETPAGFWRQIINRFKMGDINTTASQLKFELMGVDPDADPGWRATLIKEIERLEREREQYYLGEPDTKTVKGKALWALGTIADSLPYMLKMMSVQTAGGFVPYAGPFLAEFLSWEYGMEIEGGSLYYELIKKGIDHDIAKDAGLIGGALSSAVEQLMWGSISKAGKGIKSLISGKPGGDKMANYIVSHIFKDLAPGGAGANILTFLVDYLLNIPQEGSEEGVQSLVTNIAEVVAINIHNARMEGEIAGLPEDEQKAVRALRQVQKKSVGEIAHEIASEFLGGAVAALGTGVPGVVFNSLASVREARKLQLSAMESPNFAKFEQEAKKSPNFEGLPEEIVNESIKNLWKNREQLREKEEAALAEELKARRLYRSIDQSGDVFRGEGGNLDAELTRHVESGGLETGEYVVGNPQKGEHNAFAVINYEKRGNKTEITGVTIGEKYEGLRAEILRNFASEMGQEFTLDGETYKPGEGSAVARRFGFAQEQKASRNAFNFKQEQWTAQDSEADIAAKQNFARQIREAGTKAETQEQIDALVELYDMAGRKMFNMGFDKFMRRLAEDPNKFIASMPEMSDARIAEWYQTKLTEQELADKNIDLNNLSEEQKQTARDAVKGYTTTGLEGFTNSISAAKSADVSTFIHEGIHAFTNLAQAVNPELYGEMMRAAGLDMEALARASAEERGAMERSAWEKLAYQAERYFHDGAVSVADGKLRKLLDQLKEFLKGIIDVLDERRQLSPEIKALYDELFKDTGTAEERQAQTTGGMETNARQGTDSKTAGEMDIFQDEYDRIIRDESRPIEERSEAAVKKAELVYFQDELEKINEQFNGELERFLEGKIEKGHIFKLGTPGEILLRAGFPAGQEIELSATRLEEKSKAERHPFNPGDLKNLAKAVNEPVAVFAYGDRTKAQNIIIEIQQNGKNFLVGIHFDQEYRGAEISDIRTLFPKDNHEWLNWINQGKMLYADIEKLQAIIAQQRMTSAEVGRSSLEQQAPGEAAQQRMTSAEVGGLNMEPIQKLLQEHADVKHYFPRQGAILFQDAYQGSPYRFDKHNNSYVGSGWGNLRHGWGHYLYGRKEAAEWFSKSVSKLKGVEGQLYQVDIPGDEQLLQWEKPIAEQAEAVRQAADSLISWNKNGVSNFNKAYNLRKFNDGSYGFYRSIDGKMKWTTAEEAQAAAKAEIKKTLTGKEFYNTLAKNIGARETSLLLDHLGVKGTKYFDKSTEKIGVPKDYNYVIFGDNEINITKTFFQDEELAALINDYPGVVKQAAGFESGNDLAMYYAAFGDMPDEVWGRAYDAGYFDRIHRAVQEGRDPAGEDGAAPAASDGGQVGTIPGIDKPLSAKRAAAALAAYGVTPEQTLEAARLARLETGEAVPLLEELGVPLIDAQAFTEHARVFSRSEYLWLQKEAAESKKEAQRQDGHEPAKDVGQDFVETPDETIKLGAEPSDAVKKFFDELHDGAKEIYPENKWEDMEAELAGEGRTAKDFVDWVNTDKGFEDLVRTAAQLQKNGPDSGYSEADTRRSEAEFRAAQTTFNINNPNWKAAFECILGRRQVPEKTKKILRGMIRNRPLQYMEAWAVMNGDETWLPRENDVKRIKRLDTSGLVDEEYLEKQSPEELERIARKLGSERVKEKIHDGSLLLDDPDTNSYEEQLKKDQAEDLKKIERKKEQLKDYERWLKLAEENEKRHRLIADQLARDTSDKGLAKSEEARKKLRDVQRKHQDLILDMERFTQSLKASDRSNYLEFRRLLSEQAKRQEELKALADLREIKKRNMRMVLRRPDMKTVHVIQAGRIQWIQSHFDSYQLAAKWVGPGARNIRELYNKFVTDPDYRGKLLYKLGALNYNVIEHTIFRDVDKGDARAYGELNAAQRRLLKRHLIDYQNVFEELGFDIEEEPRRYSQAEYAAYETYLKDFIPADLLAKMQGLIQTDSNNNRLVKLDDWTVTDMQRLAGIVNNLRKEGRESEQARRDARKELLEERRQKTLQTLRGNMPKKVGKDKTPGIAETRMDEERRSGWRRVWYGLHNARRFFRMLEGGNDGYLYHTLTCAEYDAFNQEWGHAIERREKVARQLKEAGIKETDLVKFRFELWNGSNASLDEMLSFYYAQYNDRALQAVVFGDFGTVEERAALERMVDSRDIDGQIALENEIVGRYWHDMRKLDAFFAQGNGKYRKVMDIIGRDYDENYERLKEFVAREYNEELGSEPNYMPLMRLSIVGVQETEAQAALADYGLSRYINKGFTKGRVDIPPFAQQPIKSGMYATWDSMVQKQEHLMAYDSLMRQTKQLFEGRDNASEEVRNTLRKGWSEAAVEFVKKWTSELATPPVQEDVAALNFINRILRGHYPAAVLGWRVASILKQAIESPPPFFQFMNPGEYAAAGISCLRKETRDMIYEKSTYMKVRYWDPAASLMGQMEKMYIAGNIKKAEAALARVENIGMMGQQWIDAVCVMPGWLGAYRKKLAELNRTAAKDMTVQQIDRAAVHYADQVMRDCQPSSILMDQIPLLKGSKNPFLRMFQQFQTPMAVLFQNMFIDTPNNFRHGRILDGLWTWMIYALVAVCIGAMRDEPEEEISSKIKNRAINAAAASIESIPMFGGEIALGVESLLQTGKIRPFARDNFPVVESGIRSVNAISGEKWGKAVSNTTDMFFYLTGLPVAAKHDIEKAIEEGKWHLIFGIK